MSVEFRSKWAEIKCDYCNEEDMVWCVDAWLTDCDEEEGKVIAFIDDITGRVFYIDPVARIDKYAQEVINDALKCIEGRLYIKKDYDEYNRIIISLNIPDIQVNEVFTVPGNNC